MPIRTLNMSAGHADAGGPLPHASLTVDKSPVGLAEYLKSVGTRWPATAADRQDDGSCHLTAWMFTPASAKTGQTLVKDVPLRLYGTGPEALRAATAAQFTWTWDPKACYLVLYTFPTSPTQSPAATAFEPRVFAKWALEAIAICTPRGLASWVGSSDPNIEEGIQHGSAQDGFVVYVWSGKDADLTVKVTALARGYDLGKALRCSRTVAPSSKGSTGMERQTVRVQSLLGPDGSEKADDVLPDKECQLLRVMQHTLGRKPLPDLPPAGGIPQPADVTVTGRPPVVPALKLAKMPLSGEQQISAGGSSSQRGTQSARATSSGRRRMVSERDLDTTLENPPKSARSSEGSSARLRQQQQRILPMPRPKTELELIQSFDVGPDADNSHLPAELQNELRLQRYRSQCSEILPGALYLGGAKVASNLEILKEKGITHIVNTAADVCSNSFADRGFKYATYFLKDARDEPMLPAVLYHAILWIHSAITQEKGKVLVHCFEGVSRSSTVVVAYLMWLRCWTYSVAFDWVKKTRPICNPNTGFTCALIVLGKKLERSRTPALSYKTPETTKSYPTLSRITVHSLRSLPRPTSLMVALPVSAGSGLGSEAPVIPISIDPRFAYILQYNTFVVIILSKGVGRNDLVAMAIADHLHRVRTVEYGGTIEEEADPLDIVEVAIDGETDELGVQALRRLLWPDSDGPSVALDALIRRRENRAWDEEYAAIARSQGSLEDASAGGIEELQFAHVANYVPPVRCKLGSLESTSNNSGSMTKHEAWKEDGADNVANIVTDGKTEVYCYPDIDKGSRLTQFELDELEEGEVFIIFVPRREVMSVWIGEGSTKPPEQTIEDIRETLCERHGIPASRVDIEIVYQGDETEEFEEYFDDD
ncbi:Dual specificity protein phosphatase 14 [Perkinsus chesapeaki]|uniref:Dual specificity protein phosphatase 14 n=1 Tax=Perkinsus chesapeaki TaxID=330153 RepID=A0A7J6M5Y6_PERCH|nr:Dual specificity protein phosphatase 14 [Perkinsus chesapeaki]